MYTKKNLDFFSIIENKDIMFMYRIYADEHYKNGGTKSNILSVIKYYNTLYINDLRKRKINNIKYKIYVRKK
jgi:hypothetical protein